MNKKFLIFIVLAVLLTVTMAKISKRSHRCQNEGVQCRSNWDCCFLNCNASKQCEGCKTIGLQCISNKECCSGKCTQVKNKIKYVCE